MELELRVFNKMCLESLWSLLFWCFVSIFRTTSYFIAQEFFLQYAYMDVFVSKTWCAYVVFSKSLLKTGTQINWTLWYLPFSEFRKNNTIKNSNQILNLFALKTQFWPGCIPFWTVLENNRSLTFNFLFILFILLTLLGLVTIKLQICKKKQIMIELGNAAQKGRYERETHARYCPDEKQNAKM